MKNNLLFVTIAILLIGCNPDNFKLKSKACFDYSPTDNLKTSDTIKFSNCSLNSNYYYWDFGDGSISYEKNPKHVFKYKQSYKVKLFVANRLLGDTLNTLESDTISKFININIAIPKADFSYLFVGGFKVSFSNTSLYSSNFKWDFGDGTTSIEKEPVHFYNSKGPFIVKLKVYDEFNSDSINKTISMNDIVNLNNEELFLYTPAILDVDGDGVTDLQIKTARQDGVSTHFAYSVITPLNNYEISVDSIILETWSTSPPNWDVKTYMHQTVLVPKIYVIGDTISNSNKFSNKGVTVTDREIGYGGRSSSIYIDIWNKDEIRYIGFRKVSDNQTEIGWIKLKVLDYTNITLYSYKIPSKSGSLLIDK